MIRLSCWIASMRGVIGGEQMNVEGAPSPAPGIEAFPQGTNLDAGGNESGERCKCLFVSVAPRLARYFEKEGRHGRRH